jgi:hypothetical protein
MILAEVSGRSAIAVCWPSTAAGAYIRGGRETKGRRAGTAFSPHAGSGGRETASEGGKAGNGWREAGAAGCGDANSTVTIDSGLICVRPLGALPTQTDSGQTMTDFLFAT